MTIEKLTDTEVQIVATTSAGAKSLRLSNALTAENDRLRAVNDMCSNNFDRMVEERDRADAAESRLAAATALLVRWANTVDANVFPVPHLYLKADTEVFLASAQPAAHDPADRVLQWAGPAARADIGQPAAPTLTALDEALGDVKSGARAAPTRATWHGKPTVVWPGIPVLREPAGPRVTSLSWDRTTAPTRADAEQAVLDAVNDPECPVAAVFRAELARRGLK